MDTGAWPDRGQALRSKSTQSLARLTRAVSKEPRQQGRRGRFMQLVAADAPAAAPEAAPGRTEISAASAPRPAVPAPAASARDRRHIGWRHRHCAHRSKRLRIMGCQRDHQPDAGCRKQNRLPHRLSPLTFDCRPAGEKRVRPRKTIGSRGAGVELHPSGLGRFGRRISEGAGQECPRSRVCNFEQTGEAGAGNYRTDGRVAQSAERVREQHETVVRNHSPAAIPLPSGRQRPKRTAGAEMNQPGRCRD